MSTCHPLPRTRRRFTGTQCDVVFSVSVSSSSSSVFSLLVSETSPRAETASSAARSRTCRLVHAREGCIWLVICCHAPSLCFAQSSRSAASSFAVHGGWCRSRHCLGVRACPHFAATAAATRSHGQSFAREAYRTSSSSGDHGGAPLPTSPRRQFPEASDAADDGGLPRSDISGNTTGQYQCRIAHGPPCGWLLGSSQASAPSNASSACVSLGDSASAPQCSPTPGGTTSMTRRCDPRGHVSGEDKRTPSGVPLSGGMHGLVSSRLTCSRKLSSAEPDKTPSRTTIPSRRNVSRSADASIATAPASSSSVP
jgi:hypothetical protein